MSGEGMIQIENLTVKLGEFHLRGVNLDIRDGEYVVLLGPTGVGKSVLVECVVGIYRPNAGRILVDGQDITTLYPEERNIGFVPQDYALFPNMTVARNLAYGARARRLPADATEAKMRQMMELLGITHLRHRLPMNLSGGEKQRVALGRALITEPRILLLDEPLSALDENLRSELAAELVRVQRSLHGTFLHICHSFEEAAAVADRVAIMNDGTIIQTGTIDEILDHPATEFVARFTKTRNLFAAQARTQGEETWLHLGQDLHLCCQQPAEGQVTVAIRPEHFQVVTPPSSGMINYFNGTIIAARRKLSQMELEVDVGVKLFVTVHRVEHGSRLPAIGDRVTLHVPPQSVRLFPQSSGQFLGK